LLVDHPVQVKCSGGMVGQAVVCELGQLFPGSVINITDITFTLEVDQLRQVEVIVGDRSNGLVGVRECANSRFKKVWLPRLAP
jgi:hypothetical protein